jgi:hypothetical protein
MERRKFTREFKLEAVRLIKGSRRALCSSVAGLEGPYVAAAQLGEGVSRRSAACFSRQWPDET